MKPLQTFESLMDAFQTDFDLATVFDDFLTIAVALCGQNPKTGRSYDESLVLEIMRKYKHHELRFNFPEMLSTVTLQVTERIESNKGCDVLGEYYESRIAPHVNAPLFIPYEVSRCMAHTALADAEKAFPKTHYQILDPDCKSGRMMMEMAFASKMKHHYVGVDANPTFVKMAALNLFLSGVTSAEVMCADAEIPYDFHGSYRVSLWPFGIFRVDVKEKSPLWQMANRPVVPNATSTLHHN